MWHGVLIGSLMVLAIIGFWPSPVDAPVQGELAGVLKFLHTHGFPRWIDYSLVEESANVVLFIPLGVTVGLAFPDKQWWRNAAFGTMVSGCIELGQLLFLASRFSSPVDVVTNTAGSVIGVLLAEAFLHAVEQKQAQRLPALSLSQ
ncbi:conserved hypothetical protein [Arthrobacter sp. Hiyo6]|nr:conserved hypothetical protein [Arthrobacter sp. Hiyo6]